MDCSVVPSKRYKDMYLVSTTDFFYPLVEDPYIQGRVACANVLSDMYALGIDEIDSMLMILAASRDMAKPARNVVTKQMILGFDDLAREAGVEVTGGQTVLNPWPIIGGVAKSICMKKDIILPHNSVAGDVLVLTKPLGTQIAVNVKEWMGDEATWLAQKHLISREEGNRAYFMAQQSMARLNRTGARLMHKYHAHACTDVTGFGILGHANNLASNQAAAVSFQLHTLPCIRGMIGVSDALSYFELREGYSAETSGGLLVALSKDDAQGFCREIQEIDGFKCWVVGDVVDGDRSAIIVDDVTIVEV
jgi:selenide, water dikinase